MICIFILQLFFPPSFSFCVILFFSFRFFTIGKQYSSFQNIFLSCLPSQNVFSCSQQVLTSSSGYFSLFITGSAQFLMVNRFSLFSQAIIHIIRLPSTGDHSLSLPYQPRLSLPCLSAHCQPPASNQTVPVLPCFSQSFSNSQASGFPAHSSSSLIFNSPSPYSLLFSFCLTLSHFLFLFF